MAGIEAIPSGASNTAEIAALYQIVALKKEVQFARDIGTAALTLIQSAVADPEVAQNLDVAA